MPYVSPEQRERLASLVTAMDTVAIEDAGQLNYLVTCLVRRFLAERPRRYEHLNSAIGALEAAKLELYRRVAAPYEDAKIGENGDVY